MCYHFALVKAKASDLIKNKLVTCEQIESLPDNYLISGFEHLPCKLITGLNKNLANYSWGLIPNWVKSYNKADDLRKNTLNAKSETVFSKPSFSESIIERRCLVLASGFYEWKSIKFGKKEHKYPYYISLKNNELFVFAGIWDYNINIQTGSETRSFAIITTKANGLMAQIHNNKKRMPLILDPEKAVSWLDSGINRNEIEQLMQPFDSNILKAHTISKQIISKGTEKNTPEIQKNVSYPEMEIIQTSLFEKN
jgi:putative SOS response-associated peptidase YedK